MSAFVSAPILSPGPPHTPQFRSNTLSALRPSNRASMFPSSFIPRTFAPLFPCQTRPSGPVPMCPFTAIAQDAQPAKVTPLPMTSSRRTQIRRLISLGPVFQTAGLTLASIEEEVAGCSTDPDSSCLDDWIIMGKILENALGNQSNDVRVYQYYLPIFFWILRELQIHQAHIIDDHLPRRPFILGFSCPQGGGKTTMTTFMQTLLQETGCKVRIASLDDFYVTNKEQRQIADQNPNNKLMEFRGMPGTHDLDLINATLDDLKNGRTVCIPKYDKSAFSGRGDRAPRERWENISQSTDVVLLEGWCMGFESVPEDQIIAPDLKVVNEALKDFASIYTRLDGLFIVEISNMDWVFDWRLQAERGTRASGRPSLTDEQVTDFVSRFMPAYKQYSPQLYTRPTPLLPKHELHIQIDSQRRPVRRQKCE